MTKLELYQRVILTRDVPEEHLRQGDVAWLIDTAHDPVANEDGYILEIFNVLGESIAIATVSVDAVEPLRADFIPAARLADTA